MKTYLPIIFLLLSFTGFAQDLRKSISINQNWSFAKDADHKGIKSISKWQQVNLPHTWNAFDTMDDEPGYYRGIGWYKKRINLNQAWKTKSMYLYFEGANQETEVYLNGVKIGDHLGGYTAFTIPLRSAKFNGADEIEVKVNNRHNEDIAPLTGDFTFFGGIYRNVSLLVLDQVHFVDDQYASNGVFVRAEKVSKQQASVVVNGNFINRANTVQQLTIATLLSTNDGKKIGEAKMQVSARLNQAIAFELPEIVISKPNLWSPSQPYLYNTTTRIIHTKTGKILDEVKTSVGCRFFSFDAAKGFFLNGEPYKLIGASRHQDFAGMGNAVPNHLQVNDVKLLKEMGGNFLRVAHYPQAQAVLDACDRLGVLTSVEIPIVNEITESEAFSNNCKQMQVEMIKQNYNHPSVIIWAYMNEVLLKMRHQKDPNRKLIYLNNIALLAQRLEDLTRATDPTRYTMMSNHGDVNGYVNAGLVKIPQLVGWNLYQGWYGGKSEDFGPNLDKIHAQIPDKPLLVTEYGADVDPRLHSSAAIRFDKSLEYGMLYHQIYINDILKRPFVAGAFAWNLSDFSSETRSETMPHVNNKGLLTLDRKPKNTFYLYKAYFNPKPYVKIGDGSWNWRGATTLDQPLQVFSNASEVTLFVNGKSLGKKDVLAHITNWNVSFKHGKNEIKAVAWVNGVKIEDQSVIDFKLFPHQFKQHLPFHSIHILMGSKRQFIDPKQHSIWLPSQLYENGSWGNIGGEPFKVKSTSRQSYGTDSNIKGTANDPIYQTQLVGLDGYQLDVPKGKYEVTLHFAELMGNGIQSMLPYNLDSLIAVDKIIPEQRIFDVYLNDKLIINDLNLAATHGVAKSVVKKFECLVADDKGLKLLFKGIQGKPVLNALEVKRIN
ncbi:glycoside hydrolase family 2 TIM barrel-domain containing protein [Pedobacter insulae]|uniref:Beta-galactosidase n=1 Tax=Pedobacter insulae TaxID=414048 RepID=A0A1I2V1T6_9SPHI|nr:glycoside hydrolase family 2 TIM barrel-domain containing protein [Pedobacter insulae]SFG83182.1 beta-galactosidase [Pedobacter insulae]